VPHGGVEDVGAVLGHDERLAGTGTQDGVRGGHGVVRVDEVERALTALGAQRPAQRGGGPATPPPV
jgi:deoxycytidylate deaminase